VSVRLLRAKYTAKHGDPEQAHPFEVDREGKLHCRGMVFEWCHDRGVYVCGEHSVAFADDQLTYVYNWDPPEPAVGGVETGKWMMVGPLDPPVD